MVTKCFSCCRSKERDVLSTHEAEDPDAINLSHVGESVYEVLRIKHGRHHNKVWDVSSGKVIGEIHQTPRLSEAIRTGHSNWLPEKMCEIVCKTKRWCDIVSLAPPDGLFLKHFKDALQTINSRAGGLDEKGIKKPKVVVRMLFGNLIGLPVNCDAVIKTLTEDLPQDGSCNILVWVGAWRRRFSWNHAKFLAVDGRYLHTGGHNMWDDHYLQHNPVHDLSLEMEGEVTKNAHTFANFQWDFIKRKQSTVWGQIVEKIPDNFPVVFKTRVIVSEFPEGVAEEFPPSYKQKCVPSYGRLEGTYPVIAVGRLGAITKIVDKLVFDDRPSDSALEAMINSSHTSIKMVLQDFGPIAFPGTKIPLPGLIWPKTYLIALAHAIYRRNVVVEIILSNPQSRPSDLKLKDGAYGNGWSCNDVAAGIVQRILKVYPSIGLRKKLAANLRISYIRREKGETTYDGEATIGLHSKHFIIDDTCFYIGSQNLYYSDLAEWGVIIDDVAKTQDVLTEYWNPLWSTSYTPDDVDLDIVFANLNVDRRANRKAKKEQERALDSSNLERLRRGNSTFHSEIYRKSKPAKIK